MLTYLAQSSTSSASIDWAIVAAFLVPLITALTLLFGAAAWFVRVQIRLVTSAMEARLQLLERSYTDLQKAVGDTALTVARIEGKISSGASITTPSV